MNRNKNHYINSVFGSAVLTLGLFAAPAVSYAGFQWIPPSGAEAQQPAQAPVTVTAPDPFPQVQIIEGKAPLPPVRGGNLASPAEEKAVRGFADNIPLSVALRQILPPEIGFSVAQDVSMGTLVSWKGGAPWRQVVKDMLAPAGLTIREQGQIVHIVHDVNAPAPSLVAGTLPAVPPAPKAEASVPTQTLPAVPPVSAAPKGNALPPMDAGKPTTLLPPIDMGKRAEKDVTPIQKPALPPVPASAPPSMGYLAPPTNLASVPASSSLSAMQDRVVDSWTATKGDTLQKVLDAWCQRANVEINWQSEFDYPLQASVSFAGTFEEAVRNLLAGFQEAQPQPIGYLYNNQAAAQTVLVIQARGNNYND